MLANVAVYLAFGFFVMALLHQRGEFWWYRVLDVLLWPVHLCAVLYLAGELLVRLLGWWWFRRWGS